MQGCCHGELDKIYHACSEHEAQCRAEGDDKKIDLVLCCGDFSLPGTPMILPTWLCRTSTEPWATSAKYYSLEASAPYLTIFIGGNHEASNVLWENYYGGFLAPKLFYLGTAASCVRAGAYCRAEWIFKGRDFRRGYPALPLTEASIEMPTTLVNLRCIS